MSRFCTSPTLRVWSSGRASAFQAEERGSTPLTRSTLAPEAEADEARDCKSRHRGFKSLLVLHSPEELGWSSTRLVSGRSPVRTRPWAPNSTSSYPDVKFAFLVMCRDAALVRRKVGLDSRRRL